MPASSPLRIATGSLTRLVKEEASYHKELKQQEGRIATLKQDTSDENAEYLIRQETRAMDETKAMFPELRTKIEQALAKLEREIDNGDAQDSPENIAQAREAVRNAKAVLASS